MPVHEHDILLIDDSELIRRSVEVILRRAEWTIRTAVDGHDGLRKAFEHPPSLILLDINMTADLDGFGVCEQLRAHPDTREVPIIFLTGAEDAAAKVRAFEVGATDFVVKPFNAAELRSRVRAALHTRELVVELSAAEERYRLVMQASNDGIWDWDLQNQSVYYAPRFAEIAGCSADDLGATIEGWMNRIVSADLPPFRTDLTVAIEGDALQFESEFRMNHGDDSVRWVRCRAVIVRHVDGTPVRCVGALADITASREAQQALRDAALHDRLTGLPNRELFTNRVQHALRRAGRNEEYNFSVLFFDFDRFKVVNDSLGHEAGDALLVSIAERFRRELRDVDTAARFGGDEFVVLLDDTPDLPAAKHVCDRLIDAFNQPHFIDGHEIVSSASIGVVTNDGTYRRAEDMIRDADAAMYHAKESGKAQYKVFDDRLHQEAMRRLDLENELRAADLTSQLCVYYQPIVAMDTGVPAGFEALVRWEHPERGLIRPDHFIPIAEETGFIVPLGEHVLSTACQQLAVWSARWAGPHPLTMNVNLSKRQIIHPGLLPMIESCIASAGIATTQLKLEITETTIVDDRADLIPLLNEIRRLGVALAMDDFGTGQSSLSCLHRFPIDVLKIDRSFIQNMEDNRDFAAVIHAVVTLAQHLGMQIVAEGLESCDQIALLQAQGCDFGQGYHFARPLPPADAEAYLEEHGLLRRAMAA